MKEAILGELADIYERIETGDLQGDDRVELTMRLAVLRQAAELVKSNVLEAKLEQLEKLVEQRLSNVRRVA
jgi:hypothetical protein